MGWKNSWLTYCLQEADVFSQGAHTATEGDDEHEDPQDQQHYSWVHRHTRLWEEQQEMRSSKSDAKTEQLYLSKSNRKHWLWGWWRTLNVLSMKDCLPACFIMRAYTPIATITSEISWEDRGKKIKFPTFLNTLCNTKYYKPCMIGINHAWHVWQMNHLFILVQGAAIHQNTKQDTCESQTRRQWQDKSFSCLNKVKRNLCWTIYERAVVHSDSFDSAGLASISPFALRKKERAFHPALLSLSVSVE